MEPIAAFRLLLKAALTAGLIAALSNSLNNLLHPNLGISLYKKPGRPFRSITICPNLFGNYKYGTNVTNFQDFFTQLPSMHDIFNASFIIDPDDPNKSLNLKNVSGVREYFGFYINDTIQDSFLIEDDFAFTVYRCGTWNVQQYAEYLSRSEIDPIVFFSTTNAGYKLNSPLFVYFHEQHRGFIQIERINWDNSIYVDFNNSNNQKVVAVSAEQSLMLDRRDSPCDSNATFQQRCLADYLEENLNCNFHWLEGNSYGRKCLEVDDFVKFKKVIKQSRQKKACITLACETLSWKHRVLSEVQYSLQNDTRLYFFMNDDKIDVKKEIELYGFSNFFADFGGYLGLLLGASILSIFDSFVELLKRKKS